MSVYCQGEYLHYPLLCCLKVDNHEVAVMYLPWTAELCWPLAWSFENEELRTSSWFTAERCCSGHATERTNERSERFFPLNWLTGTEHRLRAMKSSSALLSFYQITDGFVELWRWRETCHSAKHFQLPASQMWRFLTVKEKSLSFRLKKQTEVVTLVINRETNQQLQLWCYYNVVFVVYLYISGSR